MCTPLPSVTLWGTTQITSTSTYTTTLTSLVPGDPITTVSSSVDPGTCKDGDDLAGGCTPPQTRTAVLTVTPTLSSTYTTHVETKVVVTSLVPQNTLYYPCATTTTAAAVDQAGSTSPGGADAGAGETTAADVQAQSEASTASRTSAVAAATTPATAAKDDGNLTGQFSGVGTQTLASTAAAATTTPSGAGGVSSKPVGLVSIAATDSDGSLGTPTTTTAEMTLTSVVASAPASSGSGTSRGSQDSSSTSSEAHTPAIVGGIVGALVALALLVFVVVCMMKRRRRNETGEGGGRDGDGDDFWERRFRQLEAEGTGSPGEKSVDWDLDIKSSRKLHLTLDLGSKQLSSRPTSRLSAVSTFFASFAAPQPTLLSEKRTSHILNFSRPIRRRPPLPAVTNASPATPSYPKSPQSTKSTRTDMRSSARSGVSGDCDSAKRLSPSTREADEPFDMPLANAQQSPEIKAVEAAEERTAMEWIRQSQGEEVEEYAGLSRSHEGDWSQRVFGWDPSSSTSSESSAVGPLPPRRPPAAHTADPFSPPIPASRLSSTFSQASSSAYSTHTAFGDSRAPSCLPDKQHTPASAAYHPLRSGGRTLFPASSTPAGPRAAPPKFAPRMPHRGQRPAPLPGVARSMHQTRQSQGKHVPQLRISREAITPSLWVGNDTLSRFEGAVKKREIERGRGGLPIKVGEGDLGDEGLVSAFSAPTTDSSRTPTEEDAYDRVQAEVPEKLGNGKGMVLPSPSSPGPSPSPPTPPPHAPTYSPASAASLNPPWSASSSIGSSVEDASLELITRAERSAVTPQLPVLTLRYSIVSSWEVPVGKEEWMRSLHVKDNEQPK